MPPNYPSNDWFSDVDDGSTVTDFLPAERARGITIQSAAITFNWPPLGLQPETTNIGSLPSSSVSHIINLIDTPGHADFTFEVLRSLRILDGAVCILDGVAGVEAQTEKVWAQADVYRIPRIMYINKLDREGASFGKTVREIGTRLRVWPAVCQIPWWTDRGSKVIGVGDVIHLRALSWKAGSDGRSVSVARLDELDQKDRNMGEELRRARVALIELLSEHDENMVERFLENDENHLSISASDIVRSLRKLTLDPPQVVVPVFGGASFRNIGVQPLLDAVVDLLPSPSERPDAEVSMKSFKGSLKDVLEGDLNPTTQKATQASKKNHQPQNKEKRASLIQRLDACALAFKVVHDSKRGVLVYVRVYSGSLKRNANVFNTNLSVIEKAPRLLKMYANDAVEVETINQGQIGVIVGLKYARTGDTLIAYTGNPKHKPQAPLDSLQLRPITVPPPVFFTSIEPNSLSEENHVTDMLSILLREDPSLNVSVDTDSGQTQLSGMGELHLEIARDRLIYDFKAKASTGKIEISYRETVLAASASCVGAVDREIAGKHAQAKCLATVSPLEKIDGLEELKTERPHSTVIEVDSNVLIIQHPGLSTSGEPVSGESGLPPHLTLSTVSNSIKSGVMGALARGPKHSFSVHSTVITIEFNYREHLYPNTTPAALSVAAKDATRNALKNTAENNGTALMEPVMRANITVNESDLGKVVQDISSARGGQVISLDSGDTEEAQSTSNGVSSIYDELPVINAAKIYAPPDPFETGSASSMASAHDRPRQITALVPLREMIGYLKHLRSLTGGRGTFIMSVDQFERMNTQRMKLVLAELRGDV